MRYKADKSKAVILQSARLACATLLAAMLSLFGKAHALVLRRPMRAMRYEAWAASLLKAESSLDLVRSAAEQEILTIGARLEEFHHQAKELSTTSSAVAGTLSGERMDSALDGIRQILERMEQLGNESKQTTRTLTNLLGEVNRIYAPLASFQQIVRTLRIIGTSTKIESARLGSDSTNFRTLADDVERLATEIEIKSIELNRQAESLPPLISHTLASTEAIESMISNQAKLVVDSSLASLYSLTEANESSVKSVQELSVRYSDISRSIGEIVASLQFHDITRQKVEHVKSALGSLCKDFANVQNSKVPETQQAERVANVCELQMAQLTRARDEFVAAVKSIIENLRAVAVNVDQICNQMRVLTGIAGDVEQTNLSSLEQGILMILSALRDYGSASMELVSTTRCVISTMGEMSVFIRDIERIGIQINWIALNAVVKANHVGSAGAALSALAEAIQGFSTVTAAHSTAVSDVFRSIMAVAEELRSSLDVSTKSTSVQVEGMTQRAQNLMQILRCVDEDCKSSFIRLDEQGKNLLTGIASVVGTIRVHDHVAMVVNEALLPIADVATQTRLAGLSADGAVKEQSLSFLRDQYTMDTERIVHDELAAAQRGQTIESCALNNKPASGRSGRPGGNAGDDLGDNVELF